MLLPFDYIARRYIEDIRIGQDGYAWVISKQGIEISCPVPGHVGNSVFDTCRDYPDILAMAERMMRGEDGTATYTFDRLREDVVGKVSKHAVFMPVHFENNFWSIVVATPEEEVTKTLQGFRNRFLLIAMLLVCGMGFFFYFIFRTHLVVMEMEQGKRAEAAESKYRRIFENALSGIVQATPEGKLLSVNPAFAAMCGFDSPEEMVATITDVGAQLYANAQDRGNIMVLYERDGIVKDFQTRFRRTDGRLIWVSINGRTVRDEDGKALYYEGTLSDITERKGMEDAIRESRERLSLALESSRAGIWDKNVIENKSTWDDYHHRLFSLAPGAYSGNSEDFFRMIHPDDRERVRNEMSAALDGDAEYSTSYRVVWPDSSVHFLADRGKVHRDADGRPVRMIGISWDITEIKQAEEALKESHQQLMDIINFLPDATLVIDREGRVMAWNLAMEEMTGINTEDILGKGNYEYGLPFYGDRTPILVDLVLKPRKDVEARYYNVFRKGDSLAAETYMPELRGCEVYLFGKASVLRDSRGNVVGAIESIRDITDLKRAEKERMQLMQRLQQAGKAESLGRMAGAIAHHFNNKLMVVLGNLELALYGVGDNEKLSSLLLRAHAGASQAAEVSSLMLAYLGQGMPRAEAFDLAEVCREVVETRKSPLPEGAALKMDIPVHGPVIEANQPLVRQVLSNLIANAREAIGEGGGDIHVSLRTVDATETSSSHIFPADWQSEQDSYACLEVSDTGCGISPEQLDLIFDPFFSTKFTGRGLGLAVVLGTVRSYGGAVAVESEPNRGSIFRVFWPIAEPEAQPDPQKATVASGPLTGSGLVLFVDDEAQLRDMGEKMLGLLGFEVILAAHGLEALEIFQDCGDAISVVILDLTMPGMDGWETLAALRALRPGIPVVLASGYDEAKVMEGRQAELLQAFLHKPYTMADLRAAIGAAQCC
jgi:PAS domain S-box-containing protein